MSTYGELRYRVITRVPGSNLDLVDGWLLDRYTQILDRLQWRRMDAEAVLVTVAPYTDGTLAVTNGSDIATLTGGTFTSDMTGRAIRIASRDEFYEFNFVDAGTVQLDRVYEGDTDAAAAYSVWQSVYPLPTDLRILKSISAPGWDMTRLSRAEINQSANTREATGRPRTYSLYMDDSSDPPQPQIEVYPVPDDVYSLTISYTLEAPAIAGTGTSLLPWLRPSAIVAGATSDALAAAKDFTGAQWELGKYEQYVGDMTRTESYSRGPQRIKLADWMTRHNVERALNSARNRTGPRLP